MNNIDQTKTCAITLIHGTFAKNAPWTLEGSQLRSTVGQAAGPRAVFFAFPWSGRNTDKARTSASDELASHLQWVSLNYPDVRQILVAHSHGGNVAVQALKKAASRGLRTNQISVVTLNTPFIHAIPRDIGRPLKGLIRVILGTVVFYLLYLVWTGNTSLLLFLFVYPLLDLFQRDPIDRAGDWCSRTVQSATEGRRSMLYVRISVPCQADQPMLVLTSTGDEVESAFRFIDYLGELPSRTATTMCDWIEAVEEIRKDLVRHQHAIKLVARFIQIAG